MNKLDELVAKAKGWEEHPSLKGIGCYDRGDGNGYVAGHPHWQSDISSAMGLLDELGDHCLEIDKDHVSPFYSVAIRIGRAVYPSDHDSLPTAICIAWLRYKGVAEDEITAALQEGT